MAYRKIVALEISTIDAIDSKKLNVRSAFFELMFPTFWIVDDLNLILPLN